MGGIRGFLCCLEKRKEGQDDGTREREEVRGERGPAPAARGSPPARASQTWLPDAHGREGPLRRLGCQQRERSAAPCRAAVLSDKGPPLQSPLTLITS